MKKFVFLAIGFKQPDKAIMDDWNTWFASLGDKVVDMGNPFVAGREITQFGTKDLPLDSEAITGYMIINAENIDEAEKIAKSSPIITSMRVYETMSM